MTDYVSQVYDRLWALLEEHNPFMALVKAGNRIKVAGNAPVPFKGNTTELDFPEAMLTLGTFTSGVVADDAWTSYGWDATTNPASMAWSEDWLQEYVLILTNRDMRQATANVLTQTAILALRKGGPTLKLAAGSGLAYVVKWGPVRGAYGAQKINGTDRLACRLSIPVLMRFHGEQLLA